jgi:Protein of unknown function (DUF2635)
MKVRPTPGRAVRDPETMQLLPDEGGIVRDDDPFWTRRVLDGDVEVMPDDPPPDTLSGAASGAPASARGKPAADPRQPSAPAPGGVPHKEA